MTTRFAPRLGASLAAVLPLIAAAAAKAEDVADTIIVDASVVTMDPAVPRAQAIAVRDGRVLAVGSVERILAFKGDATRVRDLDGRVVLPGFIDPHGSCIAAGLLAGSPEGSSLSDTEIATAVAALSTDARVAAAKAGQQALAARGYTTVAEAGVDQASHDALVRLAAARGMVIDVAGYATLDGVTITPGPLATPWRSAGYTNGYRVAGITVVMDRDLVASLDPTDGSDGETAVDSPPLIRDALSLAFENGWQVMARAHGAEAIGRFVDGVVEVAASKGPADRRTVLVGADQLGAEHLASLAEPKVSVAFGPGRLVLDGDRLREGMGSIDAAERLSPAATALAHGVPVAFHSSVGCADPLRVVQAAVGRRTSSGDILGPRERIDIEAAIAGVTRGAAFAIGEEQFKGSIEAGKAADLVILSGDPLSVGAAGLADLRVVETIKAGRTIHLDNGSPRPLRRRPGAAWVASP